MEIKSVFKNMKNIPVKYSCEGDDINPRLELFNIPSSTKSLALTCEDPDAPRGIFTHWVIWNINPNVEIIKENSIPLGAVLGLNDAQKKGYIGPCPPSGVHRYYFKLYALDSVLNLREGSTRKELEKAMQGHIIDKAEIIGTYSKK